MSTEISTQTQPRAIAAHNDDATGFPALVAMGDQLRRTGFLPSHIKDGVSFAAIVLMGRELGMGTMAACRKLQVIKGNVTERADSQLSRFKSVGGRSQFKELTELKAVLWLKHPNGDEHTETFSIEDAKRAGLASNENYAKHPKAMLRSRAITAGLKSIGWEGAVGIYDPDEITDSEPAREPVVTRPKFNTTETVVPLKPKRDAIEVDDPAGKARIAISAAQSVDDLDKIRRLVERRFAEGVFTEAVRDELAGLAMTKAEMLAAEPEEVAT